MTPKPNAIALVLAGLLFGINPLLGAAKPTPPPNDYSVSDATDIRVDGRLLDWPAARRIDLDRKDQVVEGQAFWRGPESLSAKCFLAYDSENLYLAVIVQQDHKPNGSLRPGSPEGDRVELTLSTGWEVPRPPGRTRRETHLILTPGEGSKQPSIWLPARSQEAPGTRLVAKTTSQGYLLEASLPWTLFPGIEVAQGKTCRFQLAVESYGTLSKAILHRLELGTGEPSQWPFLRFIGQMKAQVPDQPGVRSDPGISQLGDGTQGNLLLGTRTLEGKVLDGRGRPVPSAYVWTWPEAIGAYAGPDGTFRLVDVKVYRSSKLLASAPGWGSAVTALRGKTGLVVSLPGNGPRTWGFGFAGSVFPEKPPHPASWLYVPSEGTLSAPDFLEEAVRFVSSCHKAGGTPAVTLPLLASGDVAKWWESIKGRTGEAPIDWVLQSPPAGPSNPYAYLNAYRDAFLSLKESHPGVWVMGPFFGSGQVSRETTFLKDDGEIVDDLAVQGKFILKAPCGPAQAFRKTRELERFYAERAESLESRMDRPVPAEFILEAGCEGGDPMGYGPALWMASAVADWVDQFQGPLYFRWMGALPTDTSPVGRMTDLLTSLGLGERVNCSTLQPGIMCVARRDNDGAIRLLVVNRTSDLPFAVKATLDGRNGNLSVEAGLHRFVEFEIPVESVGVVRVPATGAPTGQWYGAHSAKRGEPIQTLEVR